MFSGEMVMVLIFDMVWIEQYHNNMSPQSIELKQQLEPHVSYWRFIYISSNPPPALIFEY